MCNTALLYRFMQHSKLFLYFLMSDFPPKDNYNIEFYGQSYKKL